MRLFFCDRETRHAVDNVSFPLTLADLLDVVETELYMDSEIISAVRVSLGDAPAIPWRKGDVLSTCAMESDDATITVHLERAEKKGKDEKPNSTADPCRTSLRCLFTGKPVVLARVAEAWEFIDTLLTPCAVLDTSGVCVVRANSAWCASTGWRSGTCPGAPIGSLAKRAGALWDAPNTGDGGVPATGVHIPAGVIPVAKGMTSCAATAVPIARPLVALMLHSHGAGPGTVVEAAVRQAVATSPHGSMGKPRGCGGVVAPDAVDRVIRDSVGEEAVSLPGPIGLCQTRMVHAFGQSVRAEMTLRAVSCAHGGMQTVAEQAMAEILCGTTSSSNGKSTTAHEPVPPKTLQIPIPARRKASPTSPSLRSTSPRTTVSMNASSPTSPSLMPASPRTVTPRSPSPRSPSPMAPLPRSASPRSAVMQMQQPAAASRARSLVSGTPAAGVPHVQSPNRPRRALTSPRSAPSEFASGSCNNNNNNNNNDSRAKPMPPQALRATRSRKGSSPRVRRALSATDGDLPYARSSSHESSDRSSSPVPRRRRMSLTTRLPRIAKPAGDVSKLSSVVTDETRIAGAKRLTVIVADDYSASLSLAVHFVRETGCTNILTAADGDELLGILQDLRQSGEDTNKAVIITDINMPGIDGTLATAKIRGDPARYGRPYVVGCTSNPTPTSKKELARVGMDNFVRKPLTREIVRAIFISVLEEHATRAS